MSESRSDREWISCAASVFGCAATPIRLRLLALIRDRGETRPSELMAATGSTQPAVTLLLKPMILSGLVERERRGQRVFYRLTETGQKVLRLADTLKSPELATATA